MKVPIPVRILLVTCSAIATAVAADYRPNIVILMADDMGYSDIGCYGGEIETPHIDQLAGEGLRFSQFYNCALCGPSRAALMTGVHPHRAGITQWTGTLRADCVTLFEILHRAGYATCATGRVDMITVDDWREPANVAKYVDRFLKTGGHKGPGGNYFEQTRNSSHSRSGEPFEYPSGRYKTDLITDFAVEFLENRAPDQPFLLYMGHHAPHWPLHAKEKDIDKYRALYRKLGWDQGREERLERMVEMGILSPDTELSPRDDRAGPWTGADHLDWEAERMAVYAAMIDSMDQSIGRVMDALRKTGAESNTLVFFLSDNGATGRTVTKVDRPGWTWRTDGTLTRGVPNDPAVMPGPADTFLSPGAAWSCLSNTPCRGHKRSNLEGGIASPLVVRWPKVIREGGKISGELSHLVDIVATCLDAAGEPYPDQFDGRTVQPLEGKSLLPVFQGESRDGHETLCWATGASRAVREGDWKLVATEGGPWELYHLGNDRSELHNLAEQHPERVTRMAKIHREWQAR